MHATRLLAAAALATPVANNQTTYLAMLHLLDPDNYGLADLESFKNGIELDPPDDEAYALVMALAAGRLDDVGVIAEALQRWAR